MSKEMDMNAFEKSLGKLKGMAQKSQLFHTASDSEPGTWAGSGTTPEEGQEDNIDDNGTDYDAVKKSLSQKVAMSKALTPAEVAIVKGISPYAAIGAKIAKGQKLTPAESWALKGGRAIFKSEEAKGPSGGAAKVSPSDTEAAGEQDGAAEAPPTNAGSDAEDKEKEPQAKKGMPAFLKDDDDDAEKSLARSIGKSAALSKGVDATPFLAEFAGAFGEALKGVESRTAQRIVKSLAPLFGKLAATEKSLAETNRLVNAQGEISKALAEAVVGIGQHIAGGADSAAAASSMPAGGPRSQLRALPGGQGGPAPIEKSLGGLDLGSNALAKSQIVDAMGEMVKSNQIASLDLIKFESTGEMSPQTHQKVQAFVAKARG